MVLLVLVVAQSAYAGACFVGEDALKKIEAFAKDGSKAKAKAIDDMLGWRSRARSSRRSAAPS